MELSNIPNFGNQSVLIFWTASGARYLGKGCDWAALVDPILRNRLLWCCCTVPVLPTFSSIFDVLAIIFVCYVCMRAFMRRLGFQMRFAQPYSISWSAGHPSTMQLFWSIQCTLHTDPQWMVCFVAELRANILSKLCTSVCAFMLASPAMSLQTIGYLLLIL